MATAPERLFETRKKSAFQTTTFYQGLPVYIDSGKPMSPDDLTRWERAWADGFYTPSAMYRLKGLKPRRKASVAAYSSTMRGRLTPLYSLKDGESVNRHPYPRKPEKIQRICPPRHARQNPGKSQISEALLAKIREVGEYLEQQAIEKKIQRLSRRK